MASIFASMPALSKGSFPDDFQKEYLKYKIISSIPLTPDTKLIRCSYVSDSKAHSKTPRLLNEICGIPACVKVKPLLAGSLSVLKARDYSPINLYGNDKRVMDLVVKGYGEHNGHKGVGQQLCDLKENDIIEVMLKKPRKFYGRLFNEQVDAGIWMHRHLCFLCCGTGIAPFMQMIRYIFSKPDGHEINVSIVFANKTVADIIMKDELIDLQRNHPNFRAVYTVSHDSDESVASEKARFSDIDIQIVRGRVTSESLKKSLIEFQSEFVVSTKIPLEDFVAKSTFILCGSKEFISSVGGKGKKIKAENIVSSDGAEKQVKNKFHETGGILQGLGAQPNMVIRL